MTNPLESIKLPLPNQEEKKQTVSSPSNSDNPLANIRQDTTRTSNIRKYQYGWAKEDMVLGDYGILELHGLIHGVKIPIKNLYKN